MARIEICGGVGSGKTTLARYIADRSACLLVEEEYQNVPFWADFFRDPETYEFHKNISFLLSYSRLIQEAEQGSPEAKTSLCDFALFQGLAYCAASPLVEDYPAAEAVFERVEARVGKPQRIIYLKCDLDTQVARIVGRGRMPEHNVPRDFLVRVNTNVKLLLSRRRQEVKILEIDTTALSYHSGSEPELARALAFCQA